MTIGQIDSIAAETRQAIEQQKQATDSIAGNAQHAAGGTREITTGMLNVKASATESGNGASDVLGAAQELSRQSEMLNSAVGQFLDGLQKQVS